ncbi:MAG: DUF3110 domain-containing protein [Bacteroidetes bacterium]|nr:DUF3110 domain-containing protein [bacterium]NBP66694.1 DUF3110 domain-containing protein [Bacteroidota bacterium]
MNVIIPPSITPFVKNKREKDKPIFTVYKHNTGVFSIQLKDFQTQYLKTTVFGFAKEKDAYKFACMIEDHRDITKEWPKKEFEDENIGLKLFHNSYNTREFPNILEIQEWNINDLKIYCMLNFTDLLYLTNIYKNDYGNFNVQGQLIKLETSIEYQAEFLKIMYDK